MHSPSARRSLSFLTAVTLAVCLFSFASRASAQAPSDPPADQTELDARIAKARKAQFWGGSAGGVLGVGVGIGAGYAASAARCDHPDYGCGLWAGLLVVPSVALVAIPSITAGFVSGIGKHRGVDGSYAAAWFGSVAGGAAGLGTGVLLTMAIDNSAGILAVPALTVLGASAGAVLAHHHSARRRFERALAGAKPSLAITSDRAGALLSVRGTF